MPKETEYFCCVCAESVGPESEPEGPKPALTVCANCAMKFVLFVLNEVPKGEKIFGEFLKRESVCEPS